ncbi:MAG: CPBP family intramembrane glutamic endopeptidase [Pseudomonadota bacterium]
MMALSLIDLFLIALICLALPIESWVAVKLAERHMDKGPSRARSWLYAYSIVSLWVIAGLALWLGIIHQGRSLADFGFGWPAGWRGQLPWALALIATGPFLYYWLRITRQADARKAVREAIDASGGYNPIIARNRSEFCQFLGLGFTAGVTEEVIFRAYLLMLFAMVMPLWLAVLLALIAFCLPHAYQGMIGVIQSFVMGAVLTGIVLLGGSIWPAVLLHIAVDWLGALINWTLVKTEPEDALHANPS